MGKYIAVDIGGTRLRAALYPSEGIVHKQISRIYTQEQGFSPLERLIDLIWSIIPKKKDINAIGVAVPGPTNAHEGTVVECPNIPGWEYLPLKQLLQERFELPVVIGNDANMAALGEWRYGAGQGHHNLLYLTVSTGIGSGIIIENSLLQGARGLAGELGHVTLQVDGPRCGCGKYGHLEALASGTAISRWVKKQIALGEYSSLASFDQITGKLISQAAESGDELAIYALARAGRFLGIALAGYLHILNPTIVVIGGGVSQSGALLFDPLFQALSENVMSPEYLKDLKIVRATFGDDAGLVGALTLARAEYPDT